MIGETNRGYCYRENKLWYGDTLKRCDLPLSDGAPCRDRAVNGPRCPYGNKALTLDPKGLVFITYPQVNNRIERAPTNRPGNTGAHPGLLTQEDSCG